MRVTVHFADSERLEGNSESASLAKLGFPVAPDSGNNELVWVSLAAIKYVKLHTPAEQPGAVADPRSGLGLPKAVIRFFDGEVLRTYRDDSFGQEGDGFGVRIWNAERGTLERVLVSLHAVKAIFFVKEWDSRTVDERLAFEGEQARPA